MFPGTEPHECPLTQSYTPDDIQFLMLCLFVGVERGEERGTVEERGRGEKKERERETETKRFI